MVQHRTPTPEAVESLVLSGGQRHAWKFDLAVEQVVVARVKQVGIDVTLRLEGPDGGTLEMDSPNGEWGLEELVWLSRQAGSYRLEVVSKNSESRSGTYELWTSRPRRARSEDRHHASLVRKLCGADALRRSAELDKVADAEPIYREVLEGWRELGDTTWQLRTYQRLGKVSELLDAPVVARRTYLEARELARATGELTEQVRNQNRLSKLALEQGSLAEAKTHIDLAIQTSQRSEDRVLLAVAKSNLATWCSLSGDNDRGLRILLEVEQIWRELDRSKNLADTLNLRGQILLKLNKLSDASDAFTRAAEAYATSNAPTRQITALVALGEVRLRQRRYELALEALQEAEALGPEGRLDGIWVAILNNDLGLAHARVAGLEGSQRLERALPYLRAALAKAEELDKPGLVALVEFNSGALLQREGHPAEALPHFRRALEIFVQRQRPLQEAMARLGLGLSLRDLGRWQPALESMERAVDLIESQRLQHVAWDFRMWFLASKSNYFEELIDLYVELHLSGHTPSTGESYGERALRVVERRRARTFLDSLRESSLRQDVPPDLLARERQLVEELAGLESGQQEAMLVTGGHVEDQRRRAILELEVVRGQIRQAHHQFADITRPGTLGANQIRQSVLDGSSQMLLFSLGKRRSFLFGISRRDGLEIHGLPDRETLKMSVANALDLVRTISPEKTLERHSTLGLLADQLLGPVYPKLEAERLVIVPDGFLELVPFAALRVPVPAAGPTPATSADRRFLVESHETVLLPSASSLVAMRQQAPTRPEPTLELGIVADPVFSEGDPRLTGAPEKVAAAIPRPLRRAAQEAGLERLERLPETRKEAEAILDLYPPDTSGLLAGFEARKGQLFDQVIGSSRILHFATHGIVDRRQPELSALALSQVDRQGRPLSDGWLHAHELFARRIAAELVVLSACQTGVGPEIPGEGIQGLTRSFLYAGAPRVITSLWNVDDASTADLMSDLYRHLLAESLMPSAALRQAQLRQLRHEDPWRREPRFWAPFFFVGDWLPDEERPTTRAPWEEDADGLAIPRPPGEDPDYPGGPDGSTADSAPAPGSHEASGRPRPAARGTRFRLRSGVDFDPNQYVNGRDAATGKLLEDEALDGASLLEQRPHLPPETQADKQLRWWVEHHGQGDDDRQVVYRVDPNRLDQAGWAVLFAPGVSEQERNALEPLLSLRREQAGDLFREIRLPAGVTSADFRIAQEIGFGPADPKVLPYYLMIVGDPREAPFEFQYGLDVQYAVGRLHLDSTEDYRRYAEGVRSLEIGGRAPERASIFGVGGQNANDQFLIDALVDPLAQDLQPEHLGNPSLSVERVPGDRKADLASLLSDPPNLLFAAGHGLRCDPEDPTLGRRQGALICSDHQRHGVLDSRSYFTGDDVPRQIDLGGLVFFLFACYGAGTPALDDFNARTLGGARKIAPYPMVSHLAKRMLGQGAQAFVGHIDRTWGLSFDWSSGQGDQVKVFSSTCRQVLDGVRLGAAMEWFNQRYAEGAAAFNELLRGRLLPRGGAERLARLRKATQDARNYVILGDPAVRLRGPSKRRNPHVGV